MEHKIGYRHRIKNISYGDAKKRVMDRLGFIKIKSGIEMLWTKRGKTTDFLGKDGNIKAIYSHTLKDFWWVS